MTEKAEAGDRAMQLQLGNVLLTGMGDVPAEPSRGLKWIVAAADAGYADAQLRLGVLYDEGRYVKADPALAFGWYEKASSGGNGNASFNLAKRYESGTSVAQDAAEAVKLYQVAATQGNATAALELGGRYDTGAKSVPLDRAQAMHWYEVAVADHAQGVFKRLCTDNTKPDSSSDDWARAVPYCEKWGDSENPSGLYIVATAYAEGKGVAKDSAHAVDAFARAANAGHMLAAETLGDIYAAGTLTPKDAGLALGWYRKAARAGSTSAVLAIAQDYERGQGTEVNPAKAARYYEIAERSGTPQQAAQASDWFNANPQVSAENIRNSVIMLKDVPRDVILYSLRDGGQPLDLVDYLVAMMTDSYPLQAQEEEVEGAAEMECTITADGSFSDCVLVKETPKDYGFGRALGQIFDKLGKSSNRADWADRYAGKTLRIVGRFQLGG